MSTNAFEPRILKVGSNEEFSKPSEAAKVAKNGDVIEINAEIYECDAGVKWKADNLTVKGINGRPVITWKNCSGNIPGGKGLWNPSGKNFSVENIEFSHAQVSDHNGAGIRYDGGGILSIKSSYFHHNQNGILVTPNIKKYPIEENEVHINHSEFAHNGYKDGRSHNIYIIKTQILRIENSYSHHVDTGHLIKSIARENYIYNNKFSDGDTGNSSYNIDITGGGIAYIIGNIIQQSQYSPNNAIIAYAAEAKKASRNNPNKKLYIINNTFINEHKSGIILRLFDHNNDFIQGDFSNNLIYGLDEDRYIQHKNLRTTNLLDYEKNIPAVQGDFQGFGSSNFHLTEKSSAVNAAKVFNQSKLIPTFEFSSNFQLKPREADNNIDIGAYEYDGTNYPSPTLTTRIKEESIDYNQSASIFWQSKYTNYCYLTTDTEQKIETTGSFITKKLTENYHATIMCSGLGGEISHPITFDVAENPKAKLLPDIDAKTLPNTIINDYLELRDPLIKGVKKHWPSGTISTVYSKDLNKVFINGGGQRHYFGNEIFEFDPPTNTIQIISKRTDVTLLDSYQSSDRTFWDLFAYKKGCSGVWHLNNEELVPAARNLKKSLLYLNYKQAIFLQGGMISCGSNYESTDGWFLNVENKQWELAHENIAEFKGTNRRQIVYDEASSLIIITHNKGTIIYDPSNGNWKKNKTKITSLSNTWQIIDKGKSKLVIIGDKSIRTVEINQLSLDSELVTKEDWEIKGAKSILKQEYINLTYNDHLNQIVSWNGVDTLYFFEFSESDNTVEIVGKKIETNGINVGKDIVYMSKMNAYLNIIDSRFNFNLFKEIPAFPFKNDESIP